MPPLSLIKRLRKLKPQPYIPPECQAILLAALKIERIADLDALLPVGPVAAFHPIASKIAIPELPPAREKGPPSKGKITNALNTFL
jgi:hypothetical protein